MQSEAAPAVTRSFEAGESSSCRARRSPGAWPRPFPGTLAFGVIRELVDDMCLVSEAELRREIRDSLASRATLIEGAAAASFAALRRYGSSWQSRCTVLIQTGANISLPELERCSRRRAGELRRLRWAGRDGPPGLGRP